VDLTNLFQSDPAAQELGLQQFGLDQKYKQQQLADLLQKNQQNSQMFPLELQKAQLGNQTTEAQLPGIKANSSSLESKADFDQKTLSGKITAQLEKYKNEIGDEHLKDLTRRGEMYSQTGQMLHLMRGPQAHAMARQILGDNYLPQFDDMPPEELGKRMFTLGAAMNEATAKQQAMQNAGQVKSDTALALEAERSRRALEVQQLRNQALEKMAKMKEDALKTRDPKKFEELAVRYKMLAEQATDPQEQQALMKEAAIALESAMRLRPADNTKPQLDPNVAPGVLTPPAPRGNPLAPQGARPKGTADDPIILK